MNTNNHWKNWPNIIDGFKYSRSLKCHFCHEICFALSKFKFKVSQAVHEWKFVKINVIINSIVNCIRIENLCLPNRIQIIPQFFPLIQWLWCKFFSKLNLLWIYWCLANINILSILPNNCRIGNKQVLIISLRLKFWI
jgi:hypothetical protein